MNDTIFLIRVHVKDMMLDFFCEGQSYYSNKNNKQVTIATLKGNMELNMNKITNKALKNKEKSPKFFGFTVFAKGKMY